MQQKDVVKIVVNAQERIVPLNQLSFTGELSFEKLMTLAFDSQPTKQDLMFTVTYRNGAGSPTDGILLEGESVRVQNDTIFNVTATDRS